MADVKKDENNAENKLTGNVTAWDRSLRPLPDLVVMALGVKAAKQRFDDAWSAKSEVRRVYDQENKAAEQRVSDARDELDRARERMFNFVAGEDFNG